MHHGLPAAQNTLKLITELTNHERLFHPNLKPKTNSCVPTILVTNAGVIRECAAFLRRVVQVTRVTAQQE